VETRETKGTFMQSVLGRIREGLGVKATLYILLDTEQESTGVKNKGMGHGE
jgi:hypothetical protein